MFSFSRLLFCLLLVLSSDQDAAGEARMPALPEESSGYVETETCLNCHGEQASAWQKSDHYWSMREATEESVLGDFDGASFKDGGVSALFFRKGNRYFVNTVGADGQRSNFEVLYTFGFDPLQQYLVAFPGGRLQSLTIAWDSRSKDEGGQRWFSLYPDQSFAPNDPLHWTGSYQNWNAMCAECHSTNLLQNYNDNRDTFATTWDEQNVGCQGCHGPGKKHLDWAKQARDEAIQPSGNASDVGLTVDLKSLGSEIFVDQCGYCHSRRESLGVGQKHGKSLLDSALPSVLSPGLYHSDGQIQGEVYVYGSFLQSKMYLAGVSCIDCHDPHTTEVRAEGNALCLQCHNESPGSRFPNLVAKNYDSFKHHRHSPGTAGAQCVNCHMPEKTYMQVDSRRDHSFRLPHPDLSEKTASPDVCTSCHGERSTTWAAEVVEDWFGKDRYRTHYGETLNAARQNQADSFAPLAELIGNIGMPDIVRATAVAQMPSSIRAPALQSLKKALKDDSALVRAYAIPSFGDQVSPEQIEQLLPLLNDPVLAVRDEALNALASVPVGVLPESHRASFKRKLAEYERRLRAKAALPGDRLKLGVFFERLGRNDEAWEQYHRALEADPYFTPARVNMVHLANERQQQHEAEELLRDAIILEDLPTMDRGNLAYMLALLLIERGNSEEALKWFEEAVRDLPGNSRLRYNQGLLLLKMEQSKKARNALLAGLEKNPGDADLLYAMIYFHMSRGQRQEALEFVTRMQQAAPADPRLVRIKSRIGLR